MQFKWKFYLANLWKRNREKHQAISYAWNICTKTLKMLFWIVYFNIHQVIGIYFLKKTKTNYNPFSVVFLVHIHLCKLSVFHAWLLMMLFRGVKIISVVSPNWLSSPQIAEIAEIAEIMPTSCWRLLIFTEIPNQSNF